MESKLDVIYFNVANHTTCLSGSARQRKKGGKGEANMETLVYTCMHANLGIPDIS